MNLFAKAEGENLRQAQPLPARMRPRSLAEFVGQQHFLGEGKLLRRLLAADRLTSVIFYGPPGTGKTTLARLLATESKRRFRQLSAVTSGVKDLRELLEEAKDRLAGGGERTLLFIDEIHRFNKAQQDALLPDVEEGVVTLVGATTSNPFFAVNSASSAAARFFSSRHSPRKTSRLCSAAPWPTSTAAWECTKSSCTTTPSVSWLKSPMATLAALSRPWKSASSPATSVLCNTRGSSPRNRFKRRPCSMTP